MAEEIKQPAETSATLTDDQLDEASGGIAIIKVAVPPSPIIPPGPCEPITVSPGPCMPGAVSPGPC